MSTDRNWSLAQLEALVKERQEKGLSQVGVPKYEYYVSWSDVDLSKDRRTGQFQLLHEFTGEYKGYKEKKFDEGTKKESTKNYYLVDTGGAEPYQLPGNANLDRFFSKAKEGDFVTVKYEGKVGKAYSFHVANHGPLEWK